MIHTKVYHPIANQLGIEAALVFGVIEYWVQANTRKRKQKAAKNGQFCVYLSASQWEQELPFVSRRQLWRALKVLKDNHLIACFEGDKDSNRANYYAINREGLLKFDVWAGGGVLRPEDGVALTPESERLQAVDVCQPDTDEGGDVCQPGTICVPTRHYHHANQAHMSPYIDIKSNKEITESKFPEPLAQASGPAPAVQSKAKGKAKEQSGGALVFEAYAFAYEKRYGCQPIRNAAVNSSAKKIFDQVGQEAMALVQFYVGMNKRWYLEKAHSLQACLGDLQAVRTAFVTGKTMTSTRAAEMDKEQSFREVIYGIEREGIEEFELFEGIGRQTDDHLASPKVLRQRVEQLGGGGSDQGALSLCQEVSVAKPSRDS